MTRPSIPLAPFLLLSLLLLPACASTGEPGTRRSQTLIERDEIMAANQMNALDLIRSARPHWLRRRGATTLNNEPDIVVYIDGIRAGTPDVLAEIPTINIEAIRHYDAREAQFRFGVGHVHGAIDVITRRS